MSKNMKAVIGVFLIFVFGFAAGWMGSTVRHLNATRKMLEDGPSGIGALIERHLTGNLSLDPDQKSKIHQIIVENVQGRMILQKQIQPQVQDLNRETYMEIYSALKPEQQTLFEKNIAKLMQRRHAAAANVSNGTTVMAPAPVAEKKEATNAP